MPSTSQMPSSFAAAASRTRGGDRGGSGDWSKKGDRTSNGSVLTFRRPSTNQLGSSHQTSQSEAEASTPASEHPPTQFHQYSNGGNDGQGDNRYNKNAILDVWRTESAKGSSNGDVSKLFVDNWDPGHSHASTARGWTKTNDSNGNSYGPDACWNGNGSTAPISLQDMTEDEKVLFAGDVNSPLKPPSQNLNKDQNNQHSGLGGRKASVSHRDGPFASSPTSSRPGTRRRETSDSVHLASPSGNGRFPRDDNGPISPFFGRKEDRAEEGDKKLSNPFGNLIRSNTAGSALGNGQSTPWGATASGTGTSTSTMGNFGSFAMPSVGMSNDKRPGFQNVSRFATLMSKDSAEDLSTKSSDVGQKSWRPRPRTDTDPYGGEEPGPSGSAALVDDGHSSPALPQRSGVDTPSRQVSNEFGMSDIANLQDQLRRREQPQQTPHGHLERDSEPFSPTETNPFRSPPSNERDAHQEGFDGDNQMNSRLQGLGGVPENPANNFNTHPRGFGAGGFDGSDRSQTSSVGAGKTFPSLGGLGGISGWPTSSNMNTPDRERSGFSSAFGGNSIFGPTGDMHSPSLGFMPTSGFSTAGRGSKLGSLFPAAMQAQMHGTENEHADHGEQRQANAFGAIGKNTFGIPSRDTDSPIRAGRAGLEDVFSNAREQQSPFAGSDAYQAFTSAASQAPTAAPTTQSFSQFSTAQTVGNYQQSQASSETSQLPQNQQRTMVMPDRMRWVYLDPQGETQGPWSGLVMHDWYKANFFSADLSVKKVEDPEFEPLGQLIRRIGNSREPFLVPSIGIPHGPATTQPPAYTPAAVTPGSVQPPFPSAFPSFGTTLTAEQQNALERRKQEEQYLMARQREFLAAQQVNLKQALQMQNHPSALHHHSSVHSLQSQPSFGSININSPMNIPTPAQMAPTNIAGFFDQMQRSAVPTAASTEYFRDDELALLNIRELQSLMGHTVSSPQDVARNNQIAHMLALKQEQEEEHVRMEQLRPADPQIIADRLREFELLRIQENPEQASQSAAMSNPIGPPQHQQQHQAQQNQPSTSYQEEPQQIEQRKEEPRSLTLTEQVQKAASAKQTPQPAPQPESPWNKVQPGLPMPFPPPQSTTPLPAPTAQRGRSNLPEALNVESRSRSQTPDVARTTPSLAPWAKEPVEAPKGPSLKEIQEIEAKKAAKAEELAAAARRAQLEQEMRMAQSAAAAPAPGLPTTSTWGASASPNSLPAGVNSVWAKPAAAKVNAPNATSSKKTLADIQREEEARKQKLLAATTAAAAATNSAAGISSGKRYADLASKSMAQPSTGGSAWSTVGAGGKVKIPTGPSAAAPAQRVASTPAIAKPSKPATATTRGGNPVGVTKQDGAKAMDELVKWAKGALGKALNAEINVDEFVSMLTVFPAEANIIAESVYASTQLMDGRRFAEEYIRRRKLAEKGIVESATANGGWGGFQSTGAGSDSKSSGGWSEVAKKGPPKPEPDVVAGGGFRVVPSKKKGKK